MPELTPEQKAQLDKNIRAMISQGASESDVMSYANDFRLKYDPELKKKEPSTPSLSAIGEIGGRAGTSNGSSPQSEKQTLTDFIYNLKTPEQKAQSKPTTKPIVASSKPFKKDEKPFDQTREEYVETATNKLNDIMYGDGDEWKDPIGSSIKGIKKSESVKDALGYHGALNLTESSLMSDGFEANRVLNSTLLGQAGNDNMTANVLKKKATEYNNATKAFDNIQDLNFLDWAKRDEFYNAAMQFYAEKNPHFKAQAEVAGLPTVENNAKRGQIVAQVMNDPDFIAYATKQNPAMMPLIQDVQEKFYQENKDYAANVIANKVSQAMEKGGYNKIDPIFNFAGENAKEVADLTAQTELTPEEYQIYKEKNVFDKLDMPSFFEGFATTAKDIGESTKNTFATWFKPMSQSVKESWNKEANHVSAEPKGYTAWFRDVGGVAGLVSTIGMTTGITGGAASATILNFLGQEIENKKAEFPDKPVTAITLGSINTLLYAMLSKDLFPANKVKSAFTSVQPELKNVVEKFTSGKISQEAARKELQTTFKKVTDFVTGTATKNTKVSLELAGIQGINRVMDRLAGMDKQRFEELHPDSEIADGIVHTFSTFAPISALGKYGELKNRNRVVEETIYDAVSNPKRTERLINEAEINLSFGTANEIKANFKVALDAKTELDALKINPKEQKRFIFEALKEKAAKDAMEASTDPVIKKKNSEVVKEVQEIKEKILNGEDADTIVTGKEQKIIDEQKEKEIELQRLEKDHEFELKKFEEDRSKLDGRVPEDRIKIEKLEEDKKRAIEDFERKSAKLKPKEEPVELFDQERELDMGDKKLNGESAVIQKAIDENVLKGMNAEMAKAALTVEGGVEQFLSDISDQALDKKPVEGISAEENMKRARETYGDELVDLAIEKFPPETKSSNVVEGKAAYDERAKLVDDIKFEDYPNDKEGEISLIKDGKKIATMDLHYGSDGLVHIKWVKVNKDFQGEGLSLLLYGKATEIAQQKGMKGVGSGFVTHSTSKTKGIYKHFNTTELGVSKGSMEEGVEGRKVILHSLKEPKGNTSNVVEGKLPTVSETEGAGDSKENVFYHGTEASGKIKVGDWKDSEGGAWFHSTKEGTIPYGDKVVEVNLSDTNLKDLSTVTKQEAAIDYLIRTKQATNEAEAKRIISQEDTWRKAYKGLAKEIELQGFDGAKFKGELSKGNDVWVLPDSIDKIIKSETEGAGSSGVEKNKELVAEFPNALELNDKGELVERGTKDGESEFAAMGRGILGYHEQYWEAIKNDTNPKELDSEKLKFLKEKYKEGKIKSLVDVFTWGNKKGREIHEKYQAEDKAPVTKPEGKSDVVVDKASNVGGDVETHKQNIHDKFRKEFEGKGVPKEQVDGAIALMEARAKSWASEEQGRNADDWYERIADVKSGDFVDGSGKQFQVEAYHGSPHDFNKFSTSKIGTGEGAAAFGHGLYFTDVKGIAEEYARRLSKSNDLPTIDGKKADDWFRDNDLKAPYSKNYWMPELLGESKSKDDALKKIDIRIKSQEGKIDGYNDVLDDADATQNERAGARRALEQLETDLQDSYDLYNAVFRAKEYEPPSDKTRKLYKVSIHEGKTPEQYDWLEWDKDLSPNKIDKIKKALFDNDLPEGHTWDTDTKRQGVNHVVHQIKDSNGNVVGEGIDKIEARKDAGFPPAFYSYSGEAKKSAEFDKIFKRPSDGKYTTGAGFYHRLSEFLGSDKAASNLLLKAGIDGVKYPAESIARGTTSDNARGFNYVVFDDKAVTIKEKIQFQNQKGAVETLADGKKVIHALESPDFSTMVHEIAHVFEGDLTAAEQKIVKDFGGSEPFARGFEKYLRDGKAPTAELKTLFDKFKEWLTNIYKTLKGSPIQKRVTPEIKQIFDRLLTEQSLSKQESGGKAPVTKPEGKSDVVVDNAGEDQQKAETKRVEKVAELEAARDMDILREKADIGELEFIAEENLPKEEVDVMRKGEVIGTKKVPNEKLRLQQKEISDKFDKLKDLLGCLTGKKGK